MKHYFVVGSIVGNLIFALLCFQAFLVEELALRGRGGHFGGGPYGGGVGGLHGGGLGGLHGGGLGGPYGGGLGGGLGFRDDYHHRF